MSVTIKGGEKLGPALAAIAKRLTNAKTVQVGFPAGATYPDGTSVPLVAALNEFGTAKAPARPFMRNTVADHASEWPKVLEAALIANDYDAAKALGSLGEVIAGQVVASIANFSGVPLSAVTVMLRGMRSQARYQDMPFGNLIKTAVARVAAGKTSYGASTKQLVDTGHLIGSVESIVE